MRHPIGRSSQKQDTERKTGKVLLKLNAPIHCNQGVITTLYASEKLAVRDTRPATPGHGVDGMTFEFCSEAYRNLLVK